MADLLTLGTLSGDKLLGTVVRRVRKEAKSDYNLRHVCRSVGMEQLLQRRRNFVKFYVGEFF
jgi:hypothetical protein